MQSVLDGDTTRVKKLELMPGDLQIFFGRFSLHRVTRVVGPEGPVILFEYPGSAHVSTWLETIDESRTSSVVWSSVNQRNGISSDPFGIEIAELVADHGRGNRKVGLDRCSLNLARSLQSQGLDVFDCMQDMLYCRRIKTPEEIACLAHKLITIAPWISTQTSAIK